MSVELVFWISIVIRVPDSLSCIPDSKAPDSGIHGKKFSGFPYMGLDKFRDTVPLTLKLLFRNDEHALIISSLLEAIFLHGYQEHGVKVRETVLRFGVNKYTPKALRLDSPL